jgi:hypothetical protein
MPDYVKIDDLGFRSLLERSGARGLPRGAEWTSVADKWWRDYFNIANVETSGWKFAGEISTNGHEVLVTVSRPLRKDRKKETSHTIDLSQCDSGNIWGLIFEEHDLVTATNGERQVIRYSKRRFYQNSLIYKTNRKIRKWKNNTRYDENATIQQVESRIPTERVVSSAAFLDRVEYISQCSDRIFKFFLFEKPFRKLHRSQSICDLAQCARSLKCLFEGTNQSRLQSATLRTRKSISMVDEHTLWRCWKDIPLSQCISSTIIELAICAIIVIIFLFKGANGPKRSYLR